MSGRKVLIIGSIVVAGVIAYEVYKHFHNKKDNCKENEPFAEDDFCSTQDAPLFSAAYTVVTKDAHEVRDAVAGSVKERHREAAKVMEESLNTIFKENEHEDIVTENSEILNKTGGELDDLLK